MSDLLINLPSGQFIDFFEHLAAPLAKDILPLDPLTQKRFSKYDRKEIEEFCRSWKEKIQEFENRLDVKEKADFAFDLDFNLSLEGTEKLSLFEIIAQADTPQLSQEQADCLYMLCIKAKELFTVVQASLDAPLLLPMKPDEILDIMVPKGYDPILTEIASFIPGWSYSHFLYFIVKGSLNIIIHNARNPTPASDKEALNEEKYHSFLQLARDFFKDDQPFQPLMNNLYRKPRKRNPESMLPLLRLFDVVRHCVASLIENRKYQTGKILAKLLYQRIDKIIGRKPLSKEDKKNKILNYLQGVQLLIVKEIGYCYLQQKDTWFAVLYGKIAHKLSIKYEHPKRQELFGIFHNAVKVLYKADEGTLKNDNKLLNKVLLLCEKNAVIFHADIVAAACGELATQCFLSKKYTDALTLCQQQLSLVLIYEKNTDFYFRRRPITSVDIKTRIGFIESLIQKNLISNREEVLSLVEQKDYSFFIKTPRIASENLTFALDPDSVSLSYFRGLLNKYKISYEINKTDKINIVLAISQEINIENLKKVLNSVKEKSKSQPIDDKNHCTASDSPLQKQNALPIVETTDTALSSLITIAPLTENIPRPSKKNRQDTNLNTSANRYRSSCPPKKPIEKPIEKPLLPKEIKWGDIVFKRDEKDDQVYPLQKGKHIPQGYLFGYLDKKALLSIDKKILNALSNILANGKLSNKGQGIKRLDKTEAAQSPYEYKIRLLGNHEKGNIRAYGYTIKATIEEQVYTLIVFNHVELNSHKKHSLPKEISRSYEATPGTYMQMK